MPMPLFLLFLLCNPSFFAEDFEGKRRENVGFALHSGAERTPVDARRRRGRVPRVRIVLYSGSIEGFSERDIRKSNTIRQRRICEAHLPISKRRRRKNVCRCPPSP